MPVIVFVVALEVLERLTSSQEPPAATSALIEKAIIDLTNAEHTGYVSGEYADPRFRKVILFGFDAVPALIAHLGDRRRSSAQIPFIDHPEVRHLAGAALEQLAGRSLDLNLHKGGALGVKDVEAWWKKARLLGEEEYLVRHVFEGPKWPNMAMLDIITIKYPRRLGELYRNRLAQGPTIPSDPIAKAIATSSLDPRTKRDLVLLGIGNKELAHRLGALREFNRLDETAFTRQLIKELNTLPKIPKQPFWISPEARIAPIVCLTEDPLVWAAFREAAERSHVGLRMELLDSMHCSKKNPNIRKQELAFLAHFLADTTVRDVASAPELFTGPYAGSGADEQPAFARIEIRNYAALCIAWCLDMKRNATPEWREQHWSNYRESVRRALQREGVPTPRDAK